MHIMRRRGWELPERLVTPEALVLRRRGRAGGRGSAGHRRAGAGADAAPATTPNPKYPPGRADHAGEIRDHLQQLLRIQRKQEPVAGGSGDEAAAVVDRDRRHGEAAAHHRHRGPAEAGAARGADLPPSLRRGLGDDRALDRFPAQPVAEDRRAAGVGEICRVRDRAGQSDGGAASRRSIPGRTSRAWRSTRRRTTWRSSPPGCTASRCRRRTAVRSG